MRKTYIVECKYCSTRIMANSLARTTCFNCKKQQQKLADLRRKENKNIHNSVKTVNENTLETDKNI